jgi:Ca-activated chloride channel family protein
MNDQSERSSIVGRAGRQSATALAALTLLYVGPLAAQQEPQAHIKSEVNMVLVDATVKDRAGHVLGDLKKEDFRLDQDGQPQAIAYYGRGELPLAVALVVQRNNWVGSFLGPLRYATLSVLKALKPEDQVALFAFDDDVERRVDLTNDKNKVAQQIELRGRGTGTNINDAVYQAAKYLRDSAPATARRVIILVSDNMPAECKPGVSHKLVLDTALEADVAVYSLKLPYRGPFMETIADRMLEHWLVSVSKLTGETGGEVVELEKEGSLYLAFQTILTRLKTRYTLGFYPVPKVEDGKLHRLNLALVPSFGNKGRDYVVVAKTGYYAPAAHVALR